MTFWQLIFWSAVILAWCHIVVQIARRSAARRATPSLLGQLKHAAASITLSENDAMPDTYSDNPRLEIRDKAV
jgi:hypothetical protein